MKVSIFVLVIIGLSCLAHFGFPKLSKAHSLLILGSINKVTRQEFF